MPVPASSPCSSSSSARPRSLCGSRWWASLPLAGLVLVAGMAVDCHGFSAALPRTATNPDAGIHRVARVTTTTSTTLRATPDPNEKAVPATDDNDNDDDSAILGELFPVLSRIREKNWQGTCRYVNGNLEPQTNLLLQGGTRYDLNVVANDDTDDPEAECTVSSFVTLPSGQTRHVRMKGSRRRNRDRARASIRLEPIEGSGPIYGVVTEVPPDTVLLNEVERSSGRIVLTSTLSLVVDHDNDDSVTELVVSSHEIGPDGKAPLEGHQIWRYRELGSRRASSGAPPTPPPSSTPEKDQSGEAPRESRNDFRGTTGR